MSIVTRLKGLAPKTPKQWALAAVGGTGLVLVGQYFYVSNKNDAWVMKAWHALGLGHGGHPGGGGGHHARLHPHKPKPGAPHALAPQHAMQPQQLQQPYLAPSYAETIIEQPVYAAPFGYAPGYGYEIPPHHFERGPWYPQTFQHEPFGHALPFGHVPSAHGGPPPGHPHHVGVDGDPSEPQAPLPTRTVVPPPGSRGIVATTPPAPTDPPHHHHHHHHQQQLQQQVAAGEFAGVQESPCGPGLWFNAATGACVPYPSTGPVAPVSTGYDWE